MIIISINHLRDYQYLGYTSLGHNYTHIWRAEEPLQSTCAMG